MDKKSVEVHDKDGKFRCELPDALLLPTAFHTQTSFDYTSGNQSNYLKFQVCGGSNSNASRTCQTYDNGVINASPTLIDQRQGHLSFDSLEDPQGLILMGGQKSPKTTEILYPNSTKFIGYNDVRYPIVGYVFNYLNYSNTYSMLYDFMKILWNAISKMEFIIGNGWI